MPPPITFEQPFDGLRGSTIRNQFWNIAKGNGIQRQEQALEDLAIQIYNKRKQEKANNYWLSRAKLFGFNSIEDVITWQKERGLVADGKFGNKSEAEFNRIKTLEASTAPTDFVPKSNTPFVNINYDPTSIIKSKNLGLQLKKQGGTMTKYQQGGQTPQQNLQQQVVQLVQAAAGGDQQATLQIEQILQAAQQGDQQAMQIAQMIQQVVEAMKQQKVAAKYGTKLSYIKRLKGECPDGEEKVYLKSGGCMCQKKVAKAQNGVDTSKVAKQNAVQLFKAKKKKLDPKTTKTLPNGKFPENWTGEDRAAWEHHHGEHREEPKGFDASAGHKGEKWTPKKNCGGKTLKLKK